MNKDGQSSTKKESHADAVELLTTDHKNVKKLFKDYQSLVDNNADSKKRGELAKTICKEIAIHAKVEEKLVYPIFRKELDVEDMINEANVEHDSVEALIEQIKSSTKKDGLFDAKVRVLGEYVDHHAKEEEKEMFPKAKESKIDLKEMGQKIIAMKEKLMAEMD